MAAEALEKSVLEGKDREQLMAIAQALGVKSVSRAKKAELIDKILEQTSTPEPVAKPAAKPAPAAMMSMSGVVCAVMSMLQKPVTGS